MQQTTFTNGRLYGALDTGGHRSAAR
jgi:hypothetical protein